MSGDWQTVDVAGKPADVFTPDNPRFALLFLHPVGQETLAHPSAAPITPLLDEFRFATVCPAGGYTWWGDRIDPAYDAALSAERYLLDRAMPWIEGRWSLPVGLFGISMGGQGALRLSFKYPSRFPAVAALAPAIEYHQYYGFGHSLDVMYTSKEQCRQDTAPMHLHPSQHPPHVYFACDPEDEDWYRGCDRLHEKMLALGVAHECDLQTSAGGHSWAYFNAIAPRALRFVAAGLERESRRLV